MLFIFSLNLPNPESVPALAALALPFHIFLRHLFPDVHLFPLWTDLQAHLSLGGSMLPLPAWPRTTAKWVACGQVDPKTWCPVSRGLPRVLHSRLLGVGSPLLPASQPQREKGTRSREARQPWLVLLPPGPPPVACCGSTGMPDLAWDLVRMRGGRVFLLFPGIAGSETDVAWRKWAT